MAKWQLKYRVDWDATHGRNGAQQTVSEMLFQGAVALVLDLAKAFERVNLLVVWTWAKHFSFPRKILRVLCGVPRAPEACTV